MVINLIDVLVWSRKIESDSIFLGLMYIRTTTAAMFSTFPFVFEISVVMLYQLVLFQLNWNNAVTVTFSKRLHPHVLYSGVNEYLVGQRQQCDRLIPSAKLVIPR